MVQADHEGEPAQVNTDLRNIFRHNKKHQNRLVNMKIDNNLRNKIILSSNLTFFMFSQTPMLKIIIYLWAKLIFTFNSAKYARPEFIAIHTK